MLHLSVVVLTKNEEANIKKCLVSIEWADEIIVIDDFSTDNTVKIAESRGAKVYKRRLKADFASQRNFGLTKANNQWVLFVDADEVVSKDLHTEIVRRVEKGNASGYLIPRQESILGKALGCSDKPSRDWSPGHIKLLRLASKDKGKWTGKVHEEWKVEGLVDEMNGCLYHDSFPSLDVALKKINYWSSIRAEELFKNGKRVRIWEILFFPLTKFIKNYFFHKGFSEGAYGIVFSGLMALHSYLVRAKLWEMRKNEKKTLLK